MYKIVSSQVNEDTTTDITLEHSEDKHQVTLLNCYPVDISLPENDMYGQTTNNPQIVLKYHLYLEEK